MKIDSCRSVWPAVLLVTGMLLVLRLPPVHAAPAMPDGDASVHAGLDYLNRQRAVAGLPTLVREPSLATAAAAHAAYLRQNPGSGAAGGGSAHFEVPGRAGFTGADVAERVAEQGYPHTEVGENISSGDGGYADSIDGLFGAIYHRLGFLSFSFDEAGLARDGEHFVYVMGRRGLRDWCQRPPSEVLAVPAVDCAGVRVKQSWFEGLCQRLPDAARYREPWPTTCSNGQRLDADYMARLCRRPPASAELRGPGRYYLLCDGRVKLRADWFDRLCEQPPAAAAYAGDGRYFELCRPPRRVNADWLEQTCARAPASAHYRASGRYLLPCTDQGIRIRAEAVEQLDRQVQARSPAAVIWPAADAYDIPPAFYEEDPDPLPDHDVSGYPISIQFNPATTAKVEMLGFELYHRVDDAWQRVTPTRLLSTDNDPHGKLTPLQFALFPLQRLSWGGRYQVRARFRRNGDTDRLKWDFKVRDPGHPILSIGRSGQLFRIDRGQHPVVYLPPRAGHAVPGRVNIGFFEPTRVRSEALDANTVRLIIEWGSCRPVTVSFDDGRSAQISRRECR